MRNEYFVLEFGHYREFDVGADELLVTDHDGHIEIARDAQLFFYLDYPKGRSLREQEENLRATLLRHEVKE